MEFCNPRFVVKGKHFGLPSADQALRSSLTLVWSSEASVRDEVVATFLDVYVLDPAAGVEQQGDDDEEEAAGGGRRSKTAAYPPSKVAVNLESEIEEAPPEHGTLRIYTNPWAHVYLDGRKVGIAPLKLKVKPGTHKVELRVDSGHVERRTVKIRAGKETRLVVKLPQAE